MGKIKKEWNIQTWLKKEEGKKELKPKKKGQKGTLRPMWGAHHREI